MSMKTFHETLDENQAEEEAVIASNLPKKGIAAYDEKLAETLAADEAVISSAARKRGEGVKRDPDPNDTVSIRRGLRDELVAIKQSIEDRNMTFDDVQNALTCHQWMLDNQVAPADFLVLKDLMAKDHYVISSADKLELDTLKPIKAWMIEKGVFVEDIERFKKVWDTATEPSHTAFLAMSENDGGVPTNDELNTMARVRAGDAIVVLGDEARQFRHFKEMFKALAPDEQSAVEIMLENGGMPSVEEVNMISDIRAGKAVIMSSDELLPPTDEKDDRRMLYLGENGFSHLLKEQQEWSLNTFGPDPRTLGLADHITKELVEVRANPYDLMEWVDIAILSIDGFWRHGGNPLMFIDIYERKIRKNFGRTWPDWRKLSVDQAIEHDRSKD